MPPVISEPPPADLLSRMLKLGDGTTITFTENDVPKPPAMSFAHDLVRLNASWDDTSVHWGSQSNPCLTIHGHRIALVYWPDVYKSKGQDGWKSGQWPLVKRHWGKWKVCNDI